VKSSRQNRKATAVFADGERKETSVKEGGWGGEISGRPDERGGGAATVVAVEPPAKSWGIYRRLKVDENGGRRSVGMKDDTKRAKCW